MECLMLTLFGTWALLFPLFGGTGKAFYQSSRLLMQSSFLMKDAREDMEETRLKA
jgi:hypothetical protein